MIRKLYTFFQKETVLSISVILAVFSMFWIKPDHTYISYIDFRTLGLLFCLMTIVAGLKEIGVFDFLAEKMLLKAHGTKAIVTLLVLLCFFFSMVITNDVALITFVPLALIMLHKLPDRILAYKSSCHADDCCKSRKYADSYRKSTESLSLRPG